jgi:hypothetical protein
MNQNLKEIAEHLLDFQIEVGPLRIFETNGDQFERCVVRIWRDLRRLDALAETIAADKRKSREQPLK